MTQDDIIRMGMEAGLYSGNPRTPGTGNMIVRRLERFVALVIEARDKELLAGRGDPMVTVRVLPLKGYESIPQTRIEWKNGKPVPGHLYTADQVKAAVLREREEFAKHVVEIARNAIKNEREACAKVCENIYTGEEATGDWPTPEMCAAAIRARGNT